MTPTQFDAKSQTTLCINSIIINTILFAVLYRVGLFLLFLTVLNYNSTIAATAEGDVSKDNKQCQRSENRAAVDCIFAEELTWTLTRQY